MMRLCFWKVVGFCGIATLAASAGAWAQNIDDDDDELSVDVRVHPTLELYARDAADRCGASPLQIRITLDNVYPQGIAKLDLYRGEKDFLDKKGKLRKIRVPAGEPGQRVCITVPAPGTYAVAGYHDLDGNRKLKKKWNFKPREPYALSNNPNITELRLPKFSEAAFEVGEWGADIHLTYFGKKAGSPDNDSDGDDS